MISSSFGSVRRVTASVLAAAAACAIAVALLLAVPQTAHASTRAAAPACPTKAYFLHKLQNRGTGAKKIESKKCVGQWAGVIATSRVTFNTLFEHQSNGQWAYRMRNKKTCGEIPKKLEYICKSD